MGRGITCQVLAPPLGHAPAGAGRFAQGAVQEVLDALLADAVAAPPSSADARKVMLCGMIFTRIRTSCRISSMGPLRVALLAILLPSSYPASAAGAVLTVLQLAPFPVL